VVLYELLCGELPFRGSKLMILHQVLAEEPRPPRKLNHKVPRDLETVCLRCLQKDPRRRYASAQELAEDLRRWLRGEPIRARPVGSMERLWKWAKRRPAVAGLVALVALVSAAGLGGILWAYGEAVWQRDLAAIRRSGPMSRPSTPSRRSSGPTTRRRSRPSGSTSRRSAGRTPRYWRGTSLGQAQCWSGSA
jgi:serine/threonine protein kinase